MRPRIKLLRFKFFEEGSPNIFYLMMVLSSFPALATSQVYLSKASYKVINLDSIEYISKHPNEKYFQIKNFNINMKRSARYTSIELAGKYQSKILIYLYYTSPFSNVNNIWLGKNFSIHIDRNLPRLEKNQRIKTFVVNSKNEYRALDTPAAEYFERLINSDLKRGYLTAIKSISQQDKNEPLILVARSGTLSEAANIELMKIIRFLVVGMAICLAMILRAEVDKKALKNIKKKTY